MMRCRGGGDVLSLSVDLDMATAGGERCLIVQPISGSPGADLGSKGVAAPAYSLGDPEYE